MKIANIDFPLPLLSALDDNELVVFAGAGVSMGKPAELPDFKGLADGVAENTGESPEQNESEDRFLGRLSKRGVNVHDRAAEFLRNVRNSEGQPPQPTSLHRDLLRLYGQPDLVRIVTTNFDHLFGNTVLSVFDQTVNLSAGPVIPLGRSFHGIVHLHGTIEDPQDMVLTDADFGRAYLTDGWARRFLVQLFRSYSVLFVGYSHQDTVMHYLSSALPADDSKPRFALVKDEETEIKLWTHLGIEPIPYPKSAGGDYTVLNEGVKSLADYATLRILDWQRQITQLAAAPPPNDEQAADLVDDAMRNVTKTRFFTRAAGHPRWIDWLDQRRHFDPLFESTDLSKKHAILGRWLADTFACRHPHEMIALIARHGSRLHPYFWSELGRTVGSRHDPPLPKGVLCQWTSLLLVSVRNPLDALYLVKMAIRCAEQGLMDHVVEIFDALIAPRITAQSEHRSSKPKPPRPAQSNSLRLLHTQDDLHWIGRLWQDALISHLDKVAEPLLERITARLRTRHRIHLAWQTDTRNFDPENFRRHAIEPHEQDDMRGISDTLVDAARDCLQLLATKRPDVADRWCHRFAKSETPLVRRLAVHTQSEREDLTPGQKYDWLLLKMDIHDLDAHHEIFRFAHRIYADLDGRRRHALIEAISAYSSPNEDQNEVRTARCHFDWFDWLRRADPDCPFLTRELDRIKAQFPEFESRDHPNLTHWMGPLRPIEHRSPWTVDELLSASADQWLDRLVSFEPDGLFGPSRTGLLTSIELAATQNFQWGHDLADALIRGNHWETDIWTVLLGAWSNPNLNIDHRLEVFPRLFRTELHDAHIRNICDFLHESAKAPAPPNPSEFLRLANALASRLWARLGDGEFDHNEQHGWLNRAISHPAGILGQFWLHSLSIWRNSQQPPPTVLTEEYRLALSEIVEDRTLCGTLGRSVLLSELELMLQADESWTTENLISLLDIQSGLPESTAAWSGFLHGNSIPDNQALLSALLKATSRIQADFRDEGLSERFIDSCVHVLFNYIDDPLPHWVPGLLRHADAELRRTIAWHIRNNLRQLDNAQVLDIWNRWLRPYWKARLQGVPAPLGGPEIGTMLSWLPHLHPVYGEALEIAVCMPHTDMKNVFVLNDIMDNNLHHVFAVSVAKLLDYLSRCDISETVWREATGLINELIQSDIPEKLKLRMREQLAEFGLN